LVIENLSLANVEKSYARSALECGTTVPLCRDMRESGAVAPHSKAAGRPLAFRAKLPMTNFQ
jgi:hypothetical protein